MKRVAVVTGGASGMGEAICHELGGRGHSVAVLDLDADPAATLGMDTCHQDARGIASHLIHRLLLRLHIGIVVEIDLSDRVDRHVAGSAQMASES